MRFARADATDLPGFDENAFVANANFARRSLANVMTEFTAVRAATVALLDGLDAELLARRGRANGREVSVRALMYMCAGHELHHRRLFRERYGLA
jgi:ribose 1,5-bisphosphokinase PhnN